MQDDEGRWLECARRGDGASFGSIVGAYQLPVFNLCYRMLGDRAEAEEAAQETFLRAFRGLKRYDPNRSFINWLLSIASNHCIDRLRRRRFRFISLESMRPGLEIADPDPGPESTLGQSEGEQQVRQMLDHLGPQDRAATIMRYWYDMSYEEIAHALDLSVGAVKSRLHRARRELAELWLSRQAPGQTISGRRDGTSAV